MLLVGGMVYGQDRSGDNKSVSLDSVVVVGNTHGTDLRTARDGTTYWNLRMMNDLPKILGNADPLHYSQMLPGISDFFCCFSCTDRKLFKTIKLFCVKLYKKVDKICIYTLNKVA